MHASWRHFLTGQHATIDTVQNVHFGNAQQELQHAASGELMLTVISQHGLIRAEGKDSTTFLQGQLTNDIRQLQGETSQYSACCTHKGRMLAIFWILQHREGYYLLQTTASLIANMIEHMGKYRLRAQVSLSGVSDEWIRLGVAGQDALSCLRRSFSVLPEVPHQVTYGENALVAALPGNIPRFEILANVETACRLWLDLAADCMPVGNLVWSWLDIQAGIPHIEPETQGMFVPQMLNLDMLGAINFKKGCYTGQEIVARTHYLGKVKRRMFRSHLATARQPGAGDHILHLAGSEAVGVLVNVAAAPSGGFDVLAELIEDHWTEPLYWGEQVLLQGIASLAESH